MIQKSTYEAPRAELYAISTQAGILTLSGGDSQAPNVEIIGSGDIYVEPKW